MNSNRSLLVIGLLLVSFLLFTQWQNDFNRPATPTTQAQSVTSTSDVPASSTTTSTAEPSSTLAKGKTITVQSDVLRLTIDALGGDIVDSDLLKYDETLHSNTPFALMQDNDRLVYVAQSGLVGENGIDNAKEGRPQYQVSADNFALAEGQDALVVPLTFEKEGVTYQKIFTLKRGNYSVGVDFAVKNATDKALSVQAYGSLKHSLVENSGNFAMPTYTGSAYSTSEVKYQKYGFDQMIKEQDRKEEQNIKGVGLSLETNKGWIAILQHYFVSAWIPAQGEPTNFFTKVIYTDKEAKKGYATITYRGETKTVAPNSEIKITSHLWTGPKDQKAMEAAAEHLELTSDYAWAWFLAQPLYMLLTFIQSLVSNWGLAIIGTTIVVKSILYPLTKAQYTSMAKMRMLQPRMQEMRERFGEDRQRMSQEMMKLYKEEKVNPLGGCLPILLQMPIFIALYWTFMEAVELRHAPFFGWIHDLSAQDPYYILPVLMGASMFLLQKMSPTPAADPMQQKVMSFMPVIFSVFFLFFPSGLVLYWLASNLITICQQWLIYRNLEKKGLHARKK